ncbi:MAG: uroporphyrinogen decarboxylase family protein [bacterium]
MTPRQRMKDFLDGKPVDRIPNGLGGCETAGLHNAAYHRLKKVLNVQDPRNRVCTFMFNAVFEPSVLKAMEGDIILLGSRMCPARFWGPGEEEEWKSVHDIWDIDIQVAKDWDFRRDPDGTWWCGGSMCPPGGLYFDSPSASTFAKEFSDEKPPSPDDFNPSHQMSEHQLLRLQEDARWLYENTDYSIACGEMIQDLQIGPGGSVAWMMRMLSEPDACHEFLDKAVDAGLAQLKQLDQAIGKYCSILGIANDMGDLRGITIGPDLWRSIYKPHYKRFFHEWHKITPMKVNLHTCGCMVDILGDLAECGVDIYNPVQVSARGMAPAVLKEKVCNKLIFHGGAFDAVHLPKRSSPDSVYDAVKSNIRALSKGGGYIFAGVHNLPGDMPETHLKAMLEAYRDCRCDPACLK